MHRIGIVGLGHLGEIHLKQWLEIVPKESIMCFDTDIERLEKLTDQYQVSKTEDYARLLDFATIIDVVTPTQFHHYYAAEALRAEKHVFIEKPVCQSMEEIDELINLQKKSGTLVQIGHVERYNPAFKAVESKILHPKFFEVHRLAPFVARGTEVSVIMDLMIHDLDIIAHLVRSEVIDIKAKGVSIISKTPDIANARLEFANGCVANLTASRISMKKMRKMRIFSDNGYISIDFLDKNAESFEIMDPMDVPDMEGLLFTPNDGLDKKLVVKSYEKLDNNAIFQELTDFYTKVTTKLNYTQVDLVSGSRTMALALKIQQLI
jgi:predicted dehydrogenase